MKSFGKNHFKRVIACILALSLIFSLGITNIIPSAATSASSAEWSGNIADRYADGTGSENDPYLISTAEQLALLVNDTNTSGKYYKLTNDIVINDDLNNDPKQWYVSAFDDTNVLCAVFAGSFDGDGHTVSGLYYNGAATNNTYWFAVGLFPHVEVGATIENVGVINSSVTITGGGAAGAIVGMYRPSSSHDTNEGQQLILRNCFADSSVSLSAANAGGMAGGLQGSAILYDCYFTGTVSATSNQDAIYGLGWSNGVHVYNYYTTSAVLSRGRNQLHSSVYTTASSSAAGIITTIAEITARDAVSTLSGFDFESVWAVSASTPVLKIFYEDEMTARAEKGIWTGAVAESYAAGNGSAESPFEIATAEQLALLINDSATSGKYYKLIADIVLNETLDAAALPWYAVGVENGTGTIIGNVFGGNFDGDGHTVSGIYYNGGATDNTYWFGIGLFPRVDVGITIENVGVINSSVTITGGGAAGAVIGVYSPSSSSDTNYLTVKNCYADSSVSLSAGNAGGMAGGINGEAYFYDCYFTGTVSASSSADAIYGLGWSNSVHTYNFYTTSAILSRGRNYLESSAFTTASGSAAGKAVTLEAITGSTAKTTLSTFDFTDTWRISDGTPVLRIFYNTECAAKGIWNGTAAETYADGDGSAENPYKIATAEQLRKLASDTDTEGKYYVLTSDIKLNDTDAENWTASLDANTWLTVYNSDVLFKGSFNGRGHTVSGLFYNASSITNGHRSGLFPVIGAGAVITNISFESCEMSVGCYGGTVAGYSDVKADEVFPEISYINVEETVNITGHAIGGVVGGGTVANFSNCCFTGNLTGVAMNGEEAKRNGIVGNFWGVGSGIFYNISDCYTWKYAPFNYANVLAVCTDTYSGTTATVGGTIVGKTNNSVKADALNELPNLNWKDVWAWEEGSLPYLALKDTAEYPSYEHGDTDCDGTVAADDLAVLRKHLLGSDFAYNADMSEDGEVNIIDLVCLKKSMPVA